MNLEFAEHIRLGLSSKNKFLSSKYFYDDEGSNLFNLITKLPEYYLTKCEYEILDNSKKNILKRLNLNDNYFSLIELGAGDGQKTKLLLEYFCNEKLNFKYFPIDISKDAFALLDENISYMKDRLNVEYLEGDYFKILRNYDFGNGKKLVVFLGSNIGNFEIENGINFLKLISININQGDFVLVGFDLKKDPKLILDAYNDNAGITKQFNLNLLKRINSEFNADFDLNNFSHYPSYNPETMECRSYLVSMKEQKVIIKDLDLKVKFEYAEIINTELSQKYDLGLIERMGNEAGFIVNNMYFDCKKYFVDVLFEKKIIEL